MTSRTPKIINIDLNDHPTEHRIRLYSRPDWFQQAEIYRILQHGGWVIDGAELLIYQHTEPKRITLLELYLAQCQDYS